MILIIKTGSSFEKIKAEHGDFEDWVIEKMDLNSAEYLIYSPENYQVLPPENRYTGIVITGSHTMVTDIELRDSKVCNWLLNAHNTGIPILGICFGHQLLSVILDGVVSFNSQGITIGTVKTYLTKDAKQDKLLKDIPLVFEVYKANRQIVTKLPPLAKLLTTGSSGTIDAFRLNSTWGVQFHPEFNRDITRAYIKEESKRLSDEGLDPFLLSKNVVEVDYGTKILKNFKEITKNAC